VAGLLNDGRLDTVYNAWRRSIRVDPLLGRQAMPDLRPFATAFNLALTGDDESDDLMASCSDLLSENLDPNIVIRVTTFLAETFTDEAGTESGAVTKSLVSTLGRVCGLLADSMVADMREMAHRDPTTGLRNRLAWNELLDSVTGKMLTASLVDLDKFKEINDSQGHDAGDRILTRFAAELTEAVDPAVVFRIGGDEYAVAWVDGDEAVLRDALEKLHESEEPASFSFGVASTSGDLVNPRQVVKKADELMYDMKHG
jgi:diguanylate cyclase (GGDEF)-like protein